MLSVNDKEASSSERTAGPCMATSRLVPTIARGLDRHLIAQLAIAAFDHAQICSAFAKCR